MKVTPYAVYQITFSDASKYIGLTKDIKASRRKFANIGGLNHLTVLQEFSTAKEAILMHKALTTSISLSACMV